MNTIAANIGMDPALKADMLARFLHLGLEGGIQEACEHIARGIFPTMEERKAAAARIDRLRERNARLFGIQDVTLDAVRESRASR